MKVQGNLVCITNDDKEIPSSNPDKKCHILYEIVGSNGKGVDAEDKQFRRGSVQSTLRDCGQLFLQKWTFQVLVRVKSQTSVHDLVDLQDLMDSSL